MTDSPAVRAPLDPQEEPILSRLLDLRDHLSLLKQDKSTYIKSQDVVALNDHVNEQVQLLNTIREQHGKPLESNRVDTVLDDCFQLISLFFLTIGRNNEVPAVYALSSTVKRLLDHLTEVQFMSAKDLESINHTLEKMEETLQKGKESHTPHLLTLLSNRITICRKSLSSLQAVIATISPSLAPTHERMISILRSISAANTRKQFPVSEVEDFKAQLKEIEVTLVDGKFTVEGTTPEGQELSLRLLHVALGWSDMVLERQGKIDERFKVTYEKLIEIRNALEKLSLTQAWSLRETDLYNFQRKLDRIDEARVNGNFNDDEGQPAELHTQRTLLYLVRRSYAYIYQLMVSSEPVSEALLPIYNQLQTLVRCLKEVKRSGGVSAARELYPYSMKLNSIDNMRVDGKFMVGSDIPEGQGSVNVLLAECFEMIYELRVEAEGDKDEADGDTNGHA